jgi:hypothetical protein
MRGASHLLLATDLPIYVGGLMRSRVPKDREWFKRYGVSDAEMDAMVRAVVDALGAEILTRKELTERVVNRAGAKAKRWVEHSWGGIVKHASLQGLVVFGPNRGRQITFVRRKKWLPRTKDLPVEEAEAMLFRRYLHGYGPASLADFAVWAGMTLGEARPIRELVGEDAVQVEVEDKACLALKEDLKALQNEVDVENGGVRLLPSFDCYMLGHKEKSHIVNQNCYKLVYRKAGWLSPVVLVNGRAEGIWGCKKKGKRMHIAIQLFDRIPQNAREHVEKEAADLARFNDTTCELSFS